MTTFPIPASVAKPDSAGKPLAAVANTKMAFANIRLGPGTRWQSVGNLRNQTLTAYFPDTRTDDGWVWVELSANVGGVGGWVSTGVVAFELIEAPESLAENQLTPFDGQIALWHEHADGVGETSVDELAAAINQNAPNVTQIWVKVCDWTREAGAQWMGFWDQRAGVAINSAADIDRWIHSLRAHNLGVCVWTTPHGVDIQSEAALVAKAAKRDGVLALVLDVHGNRGGWQGGREEIAPFMRAIRREVGDNFHIGIAFDPRESVLSQIYLEAWAGFADSLHPKIFSVVDRIESEIVLRDFYALVEKTGSGLPIYPVLGGGADVNQLREVQTLVTQHYKARGTSWWRVGEFSPIEWSVIADHTAPGELPVTGEAKSQFRYGDDIVVKPNDADYALEDFIGSTPVKTFSGAWNWTVHYKATMRGAATIHAKWSPPSLERGLYEIAVFIPARHATTHAAKYRIQGIVGGADVSVTVNQSNTRNRWMRLGVFAIDSSCSVSLNDFTGEDGKQIAFDAIRWRRVVEAANFTPKSDGYDQPVGTDADRRDAKVWGGEWLDASPFGKLYFVGSSDEAYHTGADLNLPQNADAHTPVYAAASGIVIFAGKLPVWGNVIIIKHDPLEVDGLVLYGRYAHVENVGVSVGQRVTRGEQIANVGDAFGRWAYLLHFDLSPTTILERNPGHWVGIEREAVYKNYLDPREFIERNRPK